MNKNFLMERLKEPSTWRGLIVLTTGCGVGISPEMTDAIISTGLVLAGTLGAVTPDKK